MRYPVGALIAVAALLVAGCSGSPGSAGAAGGRHPELVLRLGYVAAVQDAPAMIGIRDGLFASSLGPDVALQPVEFRSDTAEEAALNAGKLDAAYASPDVIIANLRQPRGTVIKVISGAASGGANLVVQRDITSASALRGRTLAIPSAGDAQDIALRHWLAGYHLTASRGQGAVRIAAGIPGATVVAEFRSGQIQGAWEPAPYDVEMVDADGRVLASETGTPPAGQPPAVNLVVTAKLLRVHPSVVFALIKGQVQANSVLHTNLIQANLAATAALAQADVTLPTGILAASLAQITFTDDPGAASLVSQAQLTTATGSSPLPPSAVGALYDLAPLNLVLRMAGQLPVNQ